MFPSRGAVDISTVHPSSLFHTILVLAEPSPLDSVHLDQQFAVGNRIPLGVQQVNESVTATQPVETDARPGQKLTRANPVLDGVLVLDLEPNGGNLVLVKLDRVMQTRRQVVRTDGDGMRHRLEILKEESGGLAWHVGVDSSSAEDGTHSTPRRHSTGSRETGKSELTDS